MNAFTYYILAINAAGFLLAALGGRLRRRSRRKKNLDPLLVVAAICGGSVGTVLSILIFDRKAGKDNMTSRVIIYCVLVIQIVLLLIGRGGLSEHINLKFWEFFAAHRFLSLYLFIINAAAFVAFAIDKRAAVMDLWRIPIAALLGLSFAGGTIGALAGMYIFHHKTQKTYFTVGEPLILIMQLVLLFYMMNLPVK